MTFNKNDQDPTFAELGRDLVPATTLAAIFVVLYLLRIGVEYVLTAPVVLDWLIAISLLLCIAMAVGLRSLIELYRHMYDW